MRKPHKGTLRALAKRFRAWLVTLPQIASFDEDLCGACAIASDGLARFLRKEGFDAWFVEGQYVPCANSTRSEDFYGAETNHCWVEVGRKWIVDITARQYSGRFPEVYIVPTEHEDYHRFRRGPYALRCVRREWPKDHHPLGRKLRIR